MFKKICLALVLAIGSCLAQELPYILDLIDQSTEEIDQKSDAVRKFVKQNIDLFISASSSGRFDEAYASWEDLCFRYFFLDVQLSQTSKLTPHENIKTYADEQKAALTQFMKKEFQTSRELLNTFIRNGKQAARLTPQQRYVTKKILTEYLGKSNNNTSSIKNAHQRLDLYEEQNFTVLKTGPFQSMTLDKLVVFTANIICFPGNLNYYFGGISPWKERIEKIADIIRKTDAHLICLQEVWGPEVMKALVDLLKNDYPFFIFDAGDPYVTLDPENMGFCSGLFVASRIPFESISFNTYPRVFPPKNGAKRGALLMKSIINGEEVSFINTHLQHGTDENAMSIRIEQFLRCHDLLQKSIIEKKTSRSWGMLMGDINIDALSNEFDRSGMQRLFLIPYLKGQTQVTPSNATATNYFSDLVYAAPDKRKAIVPFYEVLDYCICPRNASKPSVSTKVILFDIDKPTEAVSDHHGLLTTWNLAADR